MDDAVGLQVLGALHDLLQQLLGLQLGQLATLHEEVVEITVLAELSDDIHVVGGLVDIVQLDNVVVTDHLHDVDFGLDVLEVVGVQEQLLIDHLHCYTLTVFY